MMGIQGGFKSKKELRETMIGEEFHPIETSMFGDEYKGDGKYCIVGPSPENRKWFAEIEIRDGKIIKVK